MADTTTEQAHPKASLVPPPTRRSSAEPPKREKTAANTAPERAKPADAIDLLVDDHLAADACFKKYEKMADDEAPAEQRKALAMEICRMLTVHTRLEEEVFYPALRKAGIDADLLDEAQVEHDSAKALIAQLERGSPTDALYDAKVQVLGEYITHHVVEEHSEMFPACRRSRKLDLVTLGDMMKARKDALSANR